MDKKSANRTNNIVAGEVGVAISVNIDKKVIHKTNKFYWSTKGNDFLRAIVLPYYGLWIYQKNK